MNKFDHSTIYISHIVIAIALHVFAFSSLLASVPTFAAKLQRCEVDTSGLGNSMLQRKKGDTLMVSELESEPLLTYKGKAEARTALEYFKWWSSGKVEQELHQRSYFTIEDDELQLGNHYHAMQLDSDWLEIGDISQMLSQYKGK